MDKFTIKARLAERLGPAVRETVKVVEWRAGPIGVVLQVDQPSRVPAGYIWLPYPQDGEAVPEIALEYAAETGRHSGTYAAVGLSKGEPALKLIVRTETELLATLAYIDAMAKRAPLPDIPAEKRATEPAVLSQCEECSVTPPKKPKREAIPRAVQREVWQLDGGRCVECDSKEKLCYDHIIPFSRGGSNTIRNLQLLCEPCNLRKGNRI